jgi:hypothetical protein
MTGQLLPIYWRLGAISCDFMSIPIWDAERIEGYLEGGRTRPLLVSAFLQGPADEPVEHRQMVVKALGLPEVTERGLFSEYFGTELAVEFGVDAPLPAIVELSGELIQAAAENLARWGIAPRPGPGVGVEFRRGLAPLSRFVPVKGDAELADAVQIYAFDMLIQNPDRREDKPNCGNFKGRLVAYDHEMAFSFLYPVIGAKKPWEVPQLARQHVFQRVPRAATRRATLDWAPVRSSVARVSQRVGEFAQFLPDRWQVQAGLVVAHIHAVAEHLPAFEDALRRSLA